MKTVKSVSIRFKKLKNGLFNVYFDIYKGRENGKPNRKYHHPQPAIVVSKPYPTGVKIGNADKEMMAKADIIRNKIHTELMNDNYEVTPKTASESSVFDYIKKFRAKNSTYDALYSNIVQCFEASEQKTLSFKSIRTAHMERFIDFLKAKNLNPNTILQYKANLTTIFNTAIRHELLIENPCNKVGNAPRHRQTEKQALSIEELRVLNQTTEAINPQICKAFIFACFTSLRYSDICLLAWNDIENNIITIRPKKTKEKILKIHLHPEALKILKELPRINKNVFANFPTNAFVNNQLKLWGAKAGLKKELHFHMARHTCATMIAITSNGNILAIKEVLGHSSTKQAMEYTHIAEKQKKEAINNLPNL